ncbi:enoyl-CoA delta isomerase 1, mitochondrial isoform X1 [Amyelois transitella]|uniref:enoyl-CoA delta isomerase 1, mitochondrial isoform X1 n=2 Tax=Amyelois transitella TaxID=680683 RepID=UPI0029903395|nr:enoyl-CoA delta isomerase 1, mitochondrial isoform X1 [Amyelois transitella]
MIVMKSSRNAFLFVDNFLRMNKLPNNSNWKPLAIRGLSTLSVDDDIAVWELDRPPVNSMNLDVVTDITNVLSKVDENKWKGLIFTSASSKIFSAGLDLGELYKADPNRLRLMWHTMQEIAIKMLTCNFVTAVAINGHSSAGSTLLSMLSDHRVAVDGDHTIGFNDTAVGIVPPLWVVKLMSHTIPTRKAESAIIRSTLFLPKEALEVGMIDELASDKTDAIAKCKGFIRSMDHIAPKVISKTRQLTKRDPLSWLVENRRADCDEFVSKILSADTQYIMENYLNTLKSKKSSK